MLNERTILRSVKSQKSADLNYTGRKPEITQYWKIFVLTKIVYIILIITSYFLAL
jgi:hypothetical protein